MSSVVWAIGAKARQSRVTRWPAWPLMNHQPRQRLPMLRRDLNTSRNHILRATDSATRHELLTTPAKFATLASSDVRSRSSDSSAFHGQRRHTR